MSLPTKAAATILLLASLIAAHGADPVTSDPAVVDSAFPPAMESLRIPAAASAQVNAIIYRTGGAGRHPVVVLCHGYPGNEKNLDLAQSLRRAGYHVVYFDYRGSWGSGGAFTMANGLDDARRVLAYVRSPESAKQYGFDPARVAVVGHSYGGWVAMMLAAEDPALQAVAALAPWNAVVDIQQTGGDAAKRAKLVENLGADFDTQNGPLRGGSGEAIVTEIEQHRADYDYFQKAAAMKSKSLLFVVGSRDGDQPLPEYHEPMIRALAAVQAPRVRAIVHDDDHPFSAHRIILAREIIEWLPGALAAQH